jgi:hypothetical protein
MGIGVQATFLNTFRFKTAHSEDAAADAVLEEHPSKEYPNQD